MMSRYLKAACFALVLAGGAAAEATETYHGSFAEPADGGNLDVELSRFDGTVAYLVPRGHESEALGRGTGARRWRNMLFAIRGVQGKIVTFRLPARPPETDVMVHNMDGATINLLEPVWSYQPAARQWAGFTVVDCFRPDEVDSPGLGFPEDSVRDNGGGIVLRSNSPRREDYGWEFRNTTPFTEDVVYVSINEHYPVLEFYDWLETRVFPHQWVQPTASQAMAGTHLIGYQSGSAPLRTGHGRVIADTALYAFQIKDPAASPTKLVMLVSGQHPYEGQNKAALEAAIEWILDPHDPAAAAYRREYVTLVYPFVNPTGELAGLWRGTAREPGRDINRNWNTTRQDPQEDPGIDTVIIHKQAMLRDVAAIGLGQPYAMIDLHQNFGDQLPALHYVLHNQNAMTSALVQRLQQEAELADIISNPTTAQTLRGFWQLAGAAMTLTIERSVYSTLPAEREFGRALMRALSPDLAFAEANENPVDPTREVEPTQPGEQAPAAPPPGALAQGLQDDFEDVGPLNGRRPQPAAEGDQRWSEPAGRFRLAGGAAAVSSEGGGALIDAGSINGEVSVDLRLDGPQAEAGLVVRAVHPEDHTFFRVRAGGWTFGRRLGDRDEETAGGTLELSPGQVVRLSARMDGNTLQLAIDGVTVHQAEVVAEPGATWVGFGGTPGSVFACHAFGFAPPATGAELAEGSAEPTRGTASALAEERPAPADAVTPLGTMSIGSEGWGRVGKGEGRGPSRRPGSHHPWRRAASAPATLFIFRG